MVNTDSRHILWAAIAAPFVLLAGYIACSIALEILRSVLPEVVRNLVK